MKQLEKKHQKNIEELEKKHQKNIEEHRLEIEAIERIYSAADEQRAIEHKKTQDAKVHINLVNEWMKKVNVDSLT